MQNRKQSIYTLYADIETQMALMHMTMLPVTEFFKKYIFSLDKKINKQYFPGVLQAQ
jgi:hypothetical protein